MLASSLPTRRLESCVISERFAMVSWGGAHVKAAGVHGRFPLYEVIEALIGELGFPDKQKLRFASSKGSDSLFVESGIHQPLSADSISKRW